MEKQWKEVQLEVLAIGYGSWAPFDTLVSFVKAFYLNGKGSVDEVRENTLELCFQLIDNKWIEIIDMEPGNEGEAIQLPKDEMMALIDARWKRIGYAYPDMFDVFWYATTEEGLLAVERLSLELPREPKPQRGKTKKS